MRYYIKFHRAAKDSFLKFPTKMFSERGEILVVGVFLEFIVNMQIYFYFYVCRQAILLCLIKLQWKQYAESKIRDFVYLHKFVVFFYNAKKLSLLYFLLKIYLVIENMSVLRSQQQFIMVKYQFYILMTNLFSSQSFRFLLIFFFS